VYHILIQNSRRAASFVLIAALLCTATLGGCSAPISRDDAVKSSKHAALSLRLILAQTTCEIGEPLKATVELKNTGNVHLRHLCLDGLTTGVFSRCPKKEITSDCLLSLWPADLKRKRLSGTPNLGSGIFDLAPGATKTLTSDLEPISQQEEVSLPAEYCLLLSLSYEVRGYDHEISISVDSNIARVKVVPSAQP
jgi:hypothetical protein